jgi:hypothetical protein
MEFTPFSTPLPHPTKNHEPYKNNANQSAIKFCGYTKELHKLHGYFKTPIYNWVSTVVINPLHANVKNMVSS